MKMQCQRKQIDYTYVHTAHKFEQCGIRLGAVSLVYMLYMTSKKTTM